MHPAPFPFETDSVLLIGFRVREFRQQTTDDDLELLAGHGILLLFDMVRRYPGRDCRQGLVPLGHELQGHGHGQYAIASVMEIRGDDSSVAFSAYHAAIRA